MSRFLVLRDAADNWRRPAVPLSASIAPRDPEAPADPKLDALDLDPDALRDLLRDRSCLTVAPAMPIRLVNPEPMDNLRAEDTVAGWGPEAVGADRTGATGAGVRVALLDTGIEPSHPAFEGVETVSRDFVGTGFEDTNGHGTHMAGTILGRDVEGTRIGVARGVGTLIAGKVLNDSGLGQSDALFDALFWAIEQRADVLAFALTFDTSAQVEALCAAGYPRVQASTAAVNAYRGNLRVFELLLTMLRGTARPLILGAVGNDSLRWIAPEYETGPSAPAAARGVMPIGACGQGEAGLEGAVFSNAAPALVAPGVGIVSAASGGGLKGLNGSSMACACATGVAALWVETMRAEGAPVTPQKLAAKLIGSATRDGLAPGQGLLDCGRGLVQAPPA